MPVSEPLGPIHFPRFLRSLVHRLLDNPYCDNTWISHSHGHGTGSYLWHTIIPVNSLFQFIENGNIEDRGKSFSLPDSVIGYARFRDRYCWFDKITRVERCLVIFVASSQDFSSRTAKVLDGVAVRMACRTWMKRPQQGAVNQRISRFDRFVKLLKSLKKFRGDTIVEVKSPCGRASLARCAHSAKKHRWHRKR